MHITDANLQRLNVGFAGNFNEGRATVSPEWSKIASLRPSTKEGNIYANLGEFPQLRKWIGDRRIQSLKDKGYTLLNETHEATVEVPREKIEDDSYGAFSDTFKDMGFAAATHPDELVFNAAKNGNNAAGYDDQAFFDTDHPVVENGVTVGKSNYGGGSGAFWMLLDTRRPLKPFLFQKRRDYDFQSFQSANAEYVFLKNKALFGVDARVVAGYGLWQLAFGSRQTLDDAAFNAAYASMMALKSDEGRPLGIKPTLLCVGATNRAAALNVVERINLTGGASNPNYKAVEVMITPWLE